MVRAMNRTSACVAIVGIATFLGGCWEPDYCDPERIVFEDANLEEEVRRDLSIPWADITQEDLDRLQALSASSASIRSLRGTAREPVVFPSLVRQATQTSSKTPAGPARRAEDRRS